jgi:hypothetical protein
VVTCYADVVTVLQHFSATRTPTPEQLIVLSQMGGKTIRRGQAGIAVMGAANRDRERFPDPNQLDISR